MWKEVKNFLKDTFSVSRWTKSIRRLHDVENQTKTALQIGAAFTFARFSPPRIMKYEKFKMIMNLKIVDKNTKMKYHRDNSRRN